MMMLFQVCFFVGIGLAILSFVFSWCFDFLGIHGLDFSLFGAGFFFPLSPVLYILFLTVFGGIGWIFMKSTHPLSLVVIVVIAVLSGFLISFLFYKGVIKPLKKAQNTSTPEEEQLIGCQAKVTETIYEKGFGEISYVINGNSYTAPAKTTTGDRLEKGSLVTICWIEDHIFYVFEISL